MGSRLPFSGRSTVSGAFPQQQQQQNQITKGKRDPGKKFKINPSTKSNRKETRRIWLKIAFEIRNQKTKKKQKNQIYKSTNPGIFQKLEKVFFLLPIGMGVDWIFFFYGISTTDWLDIGQRNSSLTNGTAEEFNSGPPKLDRKPRKRLQNILIASIAYLLSFIYWLSTVKPERWEKKWYLYHTNCGIIPPVEWGRLTLTFQYSFQLVRYNSELSAGI